MVEVKRLDDAFTIASSALSAQSIRMNLGASNLANAGSVGSSDETTYHKKSPVFREITQATPGLDASTSVLGGVQVVDVKNSKTPLERRYDPSNPLADSKGFIYQTDVNPIEEMTNMIAASKEYEANVEVMNTTKNLLIQTISLLKE